MKKPEITEEKLDKLLACLVSTFESKHSSCTHKLKDCRFYLTDRMGCAKYAGLNYEYNASTSDGDVVKVLSSAFVDAVSELEHRNHISVNREKLYFIITEQGYSHAKGLANAVPNFWRKCLMWLNKNQGPLSALSIAVAVLIAMLD